MFKIYCFVEKYNYANLCQLHKSINIIYRNYSKSNKLEDLLNLKKFCKKKNYPLFLSNDLKLSLKLGLDGIYIPSFNKNINLVKKIKTPRKFKIIGSAHNINEISIKIKQGCSEIFISPIFKVKKSNKNLNICKFNLMTLKYKSNFIALGGINEKNYKKVLMTKAKGLASISWAKKNGLRNLRPF